ncbi:MAG: glycoside hydrolase family 3 protein [Clostridiales bacterium]|nr:glycoside hydrolase family 3 protein [Clostridiales bacterium]
MMDAWKNMSLSFEERTKLLVSQMTIDEKISQMTYFSSALPRFGIFEYNWWNECLHGVGRAGAATMFPQPIGMAASFDSNQLFEVAKIISTEARIKHHAAAEYEDREIYKGLTMWTPNINIFRDPRWGRGHETYGEDPFLTSRMGVSFVKGLQGDHEKYFKCIATAKHYAVHSGPEEGRHSFNAIASKKDMAETYFPAFKAAFVEGNVYSYMGAYNRVNGEAACASPYLLQQVLREEWGFDGYVVSDCGAIEDIHEHHKIAKTPAEAAALAVNGGCDLCCGYIFSHLLEAVEQGLITEETIDQSVYRLLLARFKLGMFDPPQGQPYTNIDYKINDCDEHHQKSLKMAEDSLVMLKNDGLLPLEKKGIKTIAVIGPNADNRTALYGNYAGTPSEVYTVWEGLKQVAPKGIRWILAQGCALIGGSAEESWGEGDAYRISEALKAAEIADITIVVTGLTGEQEGEEGYGSGDRSTMLLPKSQRMLLDALRTIDKPMILINMTGSATVFPHEEHLNAILQAWYPGQMGGLAVGKTIFGEANPSGRLPITFYKNMEQLPAFEDYSMKGRTYRYLDSEPAYPFGYGLSYTNFSYEKISVKKESEGLSITTTLTNTGKFDGREILQVYVRWIHSAYETPHYQLVAFKPVFLKAKESLKVELCIDNELLKIYNDEGQLADHLGTIEVFVGGGQPDKRTQALTGNIITGILAKII